MTFSTATNFLQFRTSSKLASMALLVATADFLFYGHDAGWTLGLFGLLLLLGAAIHNRRDIFKGMPNLVLFSATAGLIAALLDCPKHLTLCMFVASLFALTMLMRHDFLLKDARLLFGNTLLSLFGSAIRALMDSVLMASIRKRSRKFGSRVPLATRWLMPIILSGVFIALFALANPIITNWLSAIDWDTIAQYVSVPRVAFWLCIATLSWAVIRPRVKAYRGRIKQGYVPKSGFTLTSLLFNEHSIFTALIMFNGLFLVQNLLDVAFLWSGAALPNGMTYAEYAHRGAYPLIATALLAALFVLIALKPGSATGQMPRIRALVYAWVGQNVFLVVSSVLRLTGYIEEFSLTYLRVAALIWMGLVGIGLVLIVVRIYFGKSSLWLINANMGTLYATLYACCFIHFGSIIADYNVRHCLEVTGKGANLDVWYLEHDVGTEALPALASYTPHHGITPNQMDVLRELQSQLPESQQDWRRWTFDNSRIAAELIQQ